RADLIACSLRDAGIPTRIVPLDAAATHWPLVRAFAPNIVLGDGAALKAEGKVWLQLFQADQALKRAKLVTVPFDRLCRMDLGTVNLRVLIPQIPQLSGELSKEAHPTSGPALPPTPTRLPAAGTPAEAPPPFDGSGGSDFDDEFDDEFDRLTVARPLDVPLPAEASPSRMPEMPTVRPDAPVEAAPIQAPDVSLTANDEPLRGHRPILDSLAPPKIVP